MEDEMILNCNDFKKAVLDEKVEVIRKSLTEEEKEYFICRGIKLELLLNEVPHSWGY